MTRYFDEQLRRLDTDRVDLYLLHGLTADRWHRLAAAGVLEWAEARIRDGTVGSLGFSFHDTNSVFHEIVDAYDRWGFCQIQYNFLDELTQRPHEGCGTPPQKDWPSSLWSHSEVASWPIPALRWPSFGTPPQYSELRLNGRWTGSGTTQKCHWC